MDEIFAISSDVSFFCAERYMSMNPCTEPAEPSGTVAADIVLKFVKLPCIPIVNMSSIPQILLDMQILFISSELKQLSIFPFSGVFSSKVYISKDSPCRKKKTMFASSVSSLNIAVVVDNRQFRSVAPMIDS